MTAYEAPSTFAARGAIGPFPLRELYTFDSVPGGAYVHVVSEMDPRGAMRLLAPILAALLTRVIQGDLSRLKRRLEGEGARDGA